MLNKLKNNKVAYHLMLENDYIQAINLEWQNKFKQDLKKYNNQENAKYLVMVVVYFLILNYLYLVQNQYSNARNNECDQSQLSTPHPHHNTGQNVNLIIDVTKGQLRNQLLEQVKMIDNYLLLMTQDRQKMNQKFDSVIEQLTSLKQGTPKKILSHEKHQAIQSNINDDIIYMKQQKAYHNNQYKYQIAQLKHRRVNIGKALDNSDYDYNDHFDHHEAYDLRKNIIDSHQSQLSLILQKVSFYQTIMEQLLNKSIEYNLNYHLDGENSYGHSFNHQFSPYHVPKPKMEYDEVGENKLKEDDEEDYRYYSRKDDNPLHSYKNQKIAIAVRKIEPEHQDTIDVLPFPVIINREYNNDMSLNGDVTLSKNPAFFGDLQDKPQFKLSAPDVNNNHNQSFKIK